MLVSILVVSMMLMVIAPVLAKPYQITVVVKNIPADATNVKVRIDYPIGESSHYILGELVAVVKGKAVFEISLPLEPPLVSGDWFATVYDDLGTHASTYFTPNRQYSNRVTLEWAY